MPIAARETTRFDPPALMNGRAFPAKGRMFSITAMLMKASTASQMHIPAANKAPNSSGARRAIDQAAPHDDGVQADQNRSAQYTGLFTDDGKNAIGGWHGQTGELGLGIPNPHPKPAAH